MVNRPLFLKLVRDFWQRRGTILALVMILAVGVCNYIGMSGVYLDLNNARINYYQQYNLADFTLNLKRAPTNSVHPLIELPNILRLRPRITLDAMVQLPSKSYKNFAKLIPGTIMSLPVPERNMINNVRKVSGTWFSSPYAREIMVDQQFATARHLKVGDRINVRLPDKEHSLLLVGTVTSPEYVAILAPGSIVSDSGGYAIMYMPFNYFQQCADLNGSFNQLLGMVRNKSSTAIQNTMDLLAHKLDNYGVLLKTPQSEQISVKMINDELTNVKKVTLILPTMFFLVAILILNVMVTRLIAQQRNLIGTLKALGYGNFAIFRHYLAFAFMIGAIGGALGILFGYALEMLLLAGYRMYFAIPNMHISPHFVVFINGLILSIISALIGALISVRKTVKLAPTEAMRPPRPKKGHKIIFEKVFPKTWRKFSFRKKLVFRSILRNKVRSTVTVVASILATALVFSAFEFVDAMYYMLDFSFDTVQHQSYTIAFRDPLGKDIIRTVETIPQVKYLESQLTVPAKLQFGPHQLDMNIIGLPKNNKLYTPVDKNGQKIKVPQTGLVINEALAKKLHVKSGDSIMVRPLLGERKTIRVKIAKIIKTYLGTQAYMNQHLLSRLLGNSYLVNSLLITLHNGANSQQFMHAVHKFGSVINIESRIATKKNLVDKFDKSMIFTATIIILFAGVIAMGAILNTALISLSERERDVAGLRLLGFSAPQTAKIFFDESMILNCIGIFLGVCLGIYFAYYISIAFSTDLFRMPIVINTKQIVKTCLIMLIFVLTAQTIVYLVIRRLKWFSVLNTNE